VELPLSWDRFAPLMSVPHLPTLGPLHPHALGPRVLRDVFAVAGTGRWLAHDKDARWGGDKPEQVIDAIAGGDHVLIATLLRRATTAMVKVHCYGSVDPVVMAGAAGLARRLAARHQVSTAKVVWFLPPGQRSDPAVAATRIQLRVFDTDAPDAAGDDASVTCFRDLPAPVAASFASFADAMASDGFAFLYQRMTGDDPGLVLTVVNAGQVVGAIGPMQILADPAGQARLLPQYFGVLPTHRGRGLGRALWRAAMAWGHAHGAAYQILSTVVNGASDRLCRDEGLVDLGLVCTSPA
jgi:GNAT superfamily N-acetyltransferase